MTTKLYHGDCLKVMTDIADASVDLVLTDLPYGLTACDWDQPLDMASFWKQLLRVAKPNAAIVLTASQPYTTHLIASRPDLYRFCYYWDKRKPSHFLHSRTQPLRLIEECLVFSRSWEYTYNPQMVELDKPQTRNLPTKNSKMLRPYRANSRGTAPLTKTYTHKYPQNILDFPRDSAVDMLIPTQKPLSLIEYLMRTFSNEGDVVLDATMGAGTCGVAARNLKRQFIGIEKDKGHFDLAHKRIMGLDSLADLARASPQTIGAYKTHLSRTSAQEKAIKAAIRRAKRQKKRITKTLIANMVDITRSHLSTRYSYLFEDA